MYPQPQRILMVENCPGDLARVERALLSARGAVEVLWGTIEIQRGSRHPAELRSLLATATFDAVLLCLGADGPNPTELVLGLLDMAPYIPIVVLATENEDHFPLMAVQAGAQDYVLWSELDARTLSRAVLTSIERCQAKQQIAESRLAIVWRLAKAAECRDEVTGNHVVRVGCYSKILAETMGLNRQFVESIFVTAPLHDIGKIGIPDAILRKPGPLTPEERSVMQQHCTIGEQILRDDSKVMDVFRAWRGHCPSPIRNEPVDSLLDMACTISLTHHERWDGGGYPRQLAGEDIPLAGRIVAVSDVFDALLSERPYKQAFPESRVLEILRGEVGKHFDPAVHAALLASLDDLRLIRAEFRDPPTPGEPAPWCSAPSAGIYHGDCVP